MNTIDVRALALRTQLALQRGNPLLYGIASLCLLAALMALVLVPVWQEHLQSLQTEVQRAERDAQDRVKDTKPPEVSQDQRNLEAFLRILGDARQAEQQLQALFGMARTLQINLPLGQYKMVCEDSGLLCNYRVQLPVKGSYPQIRSFIEKCLQIEPALSLDEISIKRESAGDEELEVRLGLTLVVRATESSATDLRKAAP